MANVIKIIKKIISVLSYVLLAMAVLVFVFVLVARIKGEIPKIFGYSFHIVVTKSMETDKPDSIDVGTMVIIKSCDYEDVSEQDIILFQPDPIPQVMTTQGLVPVDKVLHRVIEIDDSGTITQTKGDANTSSDSFSVKTVYGKMVGQSKTIGEALQFLTEKNSMNFLFLGLVIMLIGIICSIVGKMVITIKEAGETEGQEIDEHEKLRQEITEKLLAEFREKRKQDAESAESDGFKTNETGNSAKGEDEDGHCGEQDGNREDNSSRDAENK